MQSKFSPTVPSSGGNVKEQSQLQTFLMRFSDNSRRSATVRRCAVSSGPRTTSTWPRAATTTSSSSGTSAPSSPSTPTRSTSPLSRPSPGRPTTTDFSPAEVSFLGSLYWHWFHVLFLVPTFVPCSRWDGGQVHTFLEHSDRAADAVCGHGLTSVQSGLVEARLGTGESCLSCALTLF